MVLRTFLVMAVGISKALLTHLVFFAVPVMWLLQRRRLAQLREHAASLGFSEYQFGDEPQLASLTGTFSDVEVRVSVLQTKKSRDAGVFITSTLDFDPEYLQLESGWLNHLARRAFRVPDGADYPRVNIEHAGFATAFPIRFADVDTAAVLAAATELLDACGNLHRRWFHRMHSWTVSKVKSKLRMQLRLDTGGEFHPSISPALLGRAVADFASVVAKWNRAFAPKQAERD